LSETATNHVRIIYGMPLEILFLEWVTLTELISWQAPKFLIKLNFEI